MKICRQMTALILSVLSALLCAFPAHAETGAPAGDLDGDMMLTHADASLLCAYLTGTADAEGAWENADLDGNGAVNAVDLTLLKRRILTKPLITPAVEQVFHCLPSTGNVRIPVFTVSFPDAALTQLGDDPAKTAAEYAFGAADPDSYAYPMESITAFYDRASYGRLHITGDAFHYSAKQSYTYYMEKPTLLVDELLAAYDGEIDFREYDSDGDSMLDGIIIILPDETEHWPYTIRNIGRYKPDGLNVGKYCIGALRSYTRAGFNSTWVHELGHAMGLPDYYKYQHEEEESMYGMNGSAGWELMDDGAGDYSAFSKLLLGWLREDEVQIYQGGTQTFSLTSMQQSPACIVIPRGDLNGFTGEYFVIEYNTAEADYTAGFLRGERFTIFQRGGIRILHCLPEIAVRNGFAEFKWNNYGTEYDKSNQKQRVLRLCSEAEQTGYLREGDTVSGSTLSGFHWYDADGYETVDAGITVQIGSLFAGPDYIEDPASSVIPDSDPVFLNGSRYVVKISETESVKS